MNPFHMCGVLLIQSMNLWLSSLQVDIADTTLVHDVMLDHDVIEVVHLQPSPPLHSILKPNSRSMSESSDDLATSYNSYCSYHRENSRVSVTSTDSILSEYDDYNCNECDMFITGEMQRKCVSFNKHIDRTTFKRECCVNSLKDVIKSHKRRQRKHELKMQNNEMRRRRRTSSGASFSSDDVSSISEASYSPCSPNVNADKSAQMDNNSTGQSGIHSEKEVSDKYHKPELSTAESDGKPNEEMEKIHKEKELLATSHNAENSKNDVDVFNGDIQGAPHTNDSISSSFTNLLLYDLDD